ncbi:GNAT family N-acetyltransferase [Geobacillus subterraneus]|uniref:GNAT family N-acetyltransferase n=1 Tax=Geobacillus subterraneus TaxID=129338 RepID=UPI001442DB56|nr:GNAT family N-acetyltransferase [Geobacillus subterraneus]QIZ67852.1 GNAT family N-acetyltransferase [Geobacillus subterraneus]
MWTIIDYQNGPFTVTTDRRRVQLERVYGFLARSYWANERSRETIVKSLDHSLCFSLFHEEAQIGMARVITDGATFAYLCDVFIDEAYRRHGLGKWLLSCVLAHPDVAAVRKVMLATKDAHGLYERFGFAAPSEPERLMERVQEPQTE